MGRGSARCNALETAQKVAWTFAQITSVEAFLQRSASCENSTATLVSEVATFAPCHPLHLQTAPSQPVTLSVRDLDTGWSVALFLIDGTRSDNYGHMPPATLEGARFQSLLELMPQAPGQQFTGGRYVNHECGKLRARWCIGRLLSCCGRLINIHQLLKIKQCSVPPSCYIPASPSRGTSAPSSPSSPTSSPLPSSATVGPACC